MRTTRVGIGTWLLSALAGCGGRQLVDDSTESHWLTGAVVVTPVGADDTESSTQSSTEGSNLAPPSGGDVPADDDSPDPELPSGADEPLGYEPLWVRQWGGVHGDVVDEIGADAHGNLVAIGHVEVGTDDEGAEDRSQFIVKLNSEGDELLRIQTDDRREIDIPANLVVNPAGDFYVAGTIEGRGYGDASVTHYAPDGQVLWTTTWGDSRTEQVLDVALDAASNVYVVGHVSSGADSSDPAFLTKLDAAGQLLWTQESPGEAASQVALDSQGNILLAIRRGYAVGSTDALVRKLDADGNLLWEREWDGPEDTTLFCLSVDAGGNVFIGGSQAESTSESEGLVAQLDPDGAVIWSRTSASTATEVTGLAPTTHGTVIAGGRGIDGQIRLSEFDTGGNSTWGIVMGENERVTTAAFTHDGRVVVAGGTYAALDGVNAGRADAFVWVLAPVLE